VHVCLPNLTNQELVPEFDKFEAFEMLSELIGGFEGESIDQNDSFHRDQWILAEKAIEIGQNCLQVLDHIPLIDFWISLEVPYKPSDYLVLEHRLSVWKFSKELVSLRVLGWPLQVLHQDILDYF